MIVSSLADVFHPLPTVGNNQPLIQHRKLPYLARVLLPRYQEEVECTASDAYLVIALFYDFTPSKEKLDGREERKKRGGIPDSRNMVKLCPINEGCLDNMGTETTYFTIAQPASIE